MSLYFTHFDFYFFFSTGVLRGERNITSRSSLSLNFIISSQCAAKAENDNFSSSSFFNGQSIGAKSPFFVKLLFFSILLFIFFFLSASPSPFYIFIFCLIHTLTAICFYKKTKEKNHKLQKF